MQRPLAVVSILSLTLPLLSIGGRFPDPLPRTFPAAITAAPTLTNPADGETLASFGPTLAWQNPPGTTQYHLEVVPFNNDGPGVNLHVGSPAGTLPIPPPPQWFGLLPDLTYTWRVR